MKCWVLMCKDLRIGDTGDAWAERIYEDRAAASHAFEVENEKREVYCWIEECEIELRSGR